MNPLADASALLDALGSRKRTTWSPHRPWPKQREWIELDVLESLYGGAAGGGKTDALLDSAMRYADVPGYSALILRRSFADLALPNSVMDRAGKWLRPTSATWNERDKRWTFPSGAVLQFGYCDTRADLDRYKSAEFQYIAVDELTEWPEDWYTFLFSRLRRRAGVNIPLRMRGATNPDGIGQEWVRQRFRIPENVAIPEPIWTGGARVFWPARAEDNPSLDLAAYEASLEQMTGGRDSVRWKQLREGLWIRDGEGLVYRYGGDINRAPGVVPRADEGWVYLLGIDYGYNDETAFVVLGWRKHEPTVYVVLAEKHGEMTPGDAAEYAHALEQRFRFRAIVGDTGGLGKGYVEEARKRFGLPIEPAEKNNKRGYIDLLNGALKSGTLKVLDGCEDLVREWTVLPWSPGRAKEAPGFPNHLADACLYGWRAAWAYLETDRQEFKAKTDAELEAEEEVRLARELDREARDASRGDRSWARRMAGRR